MDTIYWAVKLDDSSRAVLLTKFPAVHPNIFAEHMTIVFNPSESVDEAVMQKCGTDVNLEIVGHSTDDKGQAVVVRSDAVSRIGGGIAHITISCANGTRPVYSNILLQKHWDSVSQSVNLSGTIARFTKNGWDICESKKSE
ncbi:hypothetical protein LCGC14_1538820 [marine sediment metagenome]|uniref:Uncharacterized protein n=1 Tax=marine sediment metagenome TaxID=412755 RepID=A0A0F9L9S2_9ZZZZ